MKHKFCLPSGPPLIFLQIISKNQIKLSQVKCSIHQLSLYFQCKIDISYITIDSTWSYFSKWSVGARRRCPPPPGCVVWVRRLPACGVLMLKCSPYGASSPPSWRGTWAAWGPGATDAPQGPPAWRGGSSAARWALRGGSATKSNHYLPEIILSWK